MPDCSELREIAKRYVRHVKERIEAFDDILHAVERGQEPNLRKLSPRPRKVSSRSRRSPSRFRSDRALPLAGPARLLSGAVIRPRVTLIALNALSWPPVLGQHLSAGR